MQVNSAAATHAGRVRPVNEDAFLALSELVLVADGMGGHARGDVASARAVSTFETLALSSPLCVDDIGAAVIRANHIITSEASEHPEMTGMGTTLTGVAVVDEAGIPHWLVFNIGDSRVYRISGGLAHQLTVDHSEVAELLAAGRITRPEADRHPLRHVITRSLGTEPPPIADMWLMPIDPTDLFLICTDGLTNELRDDDIARLITTAPDLATAASALVEAAVAAGGRDNVTVVLVSSPTDFEEQSTLTEDETTVQTVPRGAGAGTGVGLT